MQTEKVSCICQECGNTFERPQSYLLQPKRSWYSRKLRYCDACYETFKGRAIKSLDKLAEYLAQFK